MRITMTLHQNNQNAIKSIEIVRPEPTAQPIISARKSSLSSFESKTSLLLDRINISDALVTKDSQRVRPFFRIKA